MLARGRPSDLLSTLALVLLTQRHVRADARAMRLSLLMALAWGLVAVAVAVADGLSSKCSPREVANTAFMCNCEPYDADTMTNATSILTYKVGRI